MNIHTLTALDAAIRRAAETAISSRIWEVDLDRLYDLLDMCEMIGTAASEARRRIIDALPASIPLKR